MLGNQAFSRLMRSGLETPGRNDAREREATARSQDGSALTAGTGSDPVRFHTDGRAAKMAFALDSRAFTIGRDVFFGAGQHDPESPSGRTLIRHELAHARLHGGGPQPALLRQPRLSLGPSGPEERLTLQPGVPPPEVTESNGSTLATVYFGQDDFLLGSPSAIRLLERLSRRLRFMDRPTVRVDGHASMEGTSAHNQELSENRRQAVIALLSQGLTGPLAFEGGAHGENEPAVPETGSGEERERQRALNRRVEILIVPRFTPTSEKPKKPRILRPTFTPRPETDSERIERLLREPRPEPIPRISLSEAVMRRVDEAVDRALRPTGLSREWRSRIRRAARSAVSSAASRALDAVLDEAPIGSEERDAIRAAVRAAVRSPAIPD